MILCNSDIKLQWLNIYHTCSGGFLARVDSPIFHRCNQVLWMVSNWELCKSAWSTALIPASFSFLSRSRTLRRHLWRSPLYLGFSSPCSTYFASSSSLRNNAEIAMLDRKQKSAESRVYSLYHCQCYFQRNVSSFHTRDMPYPLEQTFSLLTALGVSNDLLSRTDLHYFPSQTHLDDVRTVV